MFTQTFAGDEDGAMVCFDDDQYGTGRRLWQKRAGPSMSGLCGWLAQDPSDITIERMAMPIGRFDRTPLQSVVSGRGAAALSGSIDCTSLFHEDGLIVALWGSPGQHAAHLAQRWRSHGPWACASLSGHFAFAILDERAGQALLAVDRFATRPLHYQMSGQNLLFASSQDALLRHPLAGREPDPDALYAYLALGFMHGSAWDGMQQLGPGEYLHLRAGRQVRQPWWRMRFHEHSAPGMCLHEAIDIALSHALGNLAPGVTLDAGNASAALAAPRQASRAIPAFAIAYAPAGRRYPSPVLPLAYHELEVTSADLVDAIPKLAAWSDRPCGDPGVVAHYFCALHARAQGTLRLLSGVGAAELCGAGMLALRQRRLARYRAFREPVRRYVLAPLATTLGKGASMPPIAHDLPEDVLQAGPFNPAGAWHQLAPALLSALDLGAPLATLRQWWWTAQCKSDTNRAIALDLRATLPALVAAGSAGCALAGVDIAFPFLDPAVVDYAMHTAPRLKHPGRSTPHARSLRALVPERLRHAGHGILPFAAWLETDADLRALAFDSLVDLRQRHVVADGVIDALLAGGAAGRPNGAVIWQLMMLEQWFVYRAPHRLLRVPAVAPGTTPRRRADDPHPVRQPG